MTTVRGLGKVTILCGDAVARLRELPDESVHCCVTSPPYWSLRDYGERGQIGLERAPREWCRRLVRVFREVRRALRPDGTLWVVAGDAYVGSWGARSRGKQGESGWLKSRRAAFQYEIAAGHAIGDAAGRGACKKQRPSDLGLKRKDLVGLPWMLAFALRDDGWHLRRDIIWHKPNARPESCKDRPTTSHDYVFLLSRSASYYYDPEPGRTPYKPSTRPQMTTRYDGSPRKPYSENGVQDASELKRRICRGLLANGGANARSVWSIPTEPFTEDHYAAYPRRLVEPCVLAGSPVGGTVLDPFLGSGTTALVATALGRDCVGVEISPKYCAMAEKRLRRAHGMFARVEIVA